MCHMKLFYVTMIIFFTFQFIYSQDLTQEFEFMVDDSLRSCIIYEPNLDPNPAGYPLVVGFHGGGALQKGYSFLGTAFLIPKAKSEKFIAVCPNAYTLFWNAGSGYETITNGINDVGFISALIDSMIVNYNIDTTRIYLMGHSNGSMMAYRVAAELSERIAGLAVNSGQMVYEYANPDSPVPILHFHGTEDDKCAYNGATTEDSSLVIPPVETVMEMWRGFNHCTSIPDTILNENGILGRKWLSTVRNGDVILYTNEGWGHGWQRSSEAGIDATDVMWDFLKLHQRDSTTSIENDIKQSLPESFKLYQNFPNPFNPITVISYQLSVVGFVELNVYNSAGQFVRCLFSGFQSPGYHEVVWEGMDQSGEQVSSGIYIYRLSTENYSEQKKMILLH